MFRVYLKLPLFFSLLSKNLLIFITPKMPHSLIYLPLCSVLDVRSIELTPLHTLWKKLLFDKTTCVVVSIFIPLAITDIRHKLSGRIKHMMKR